MACDGQDCRVEWFRFRKVEQVPKRVRRRPKAGEIETIDKGDEAWEIARALAKRYVDGLAPFYRPIEAHGCPKMKPGADEEECVCKPTETPDPKEDKLWGPWELTDIVFIFTDETGEWSIVVEGEVSRTTGAGICRPRRDPVVIPK